MVTEGVRLWLAVAEAEVDGVGRCDNDWLRVDDSDEVAEPDRLAECD